MATQPVESFSHHEIHEYTDTPMKQMYRQIASNWAPIWKGQEPPDFALMRETIKHHDDTEFDVRPRLYAMPEKGPTGRGFHEDDPETAHFVRHTLSKINPVLARAYMGGAVSDHHDRLQYNEDITYGNTGYDRSRDIRRRQHDLYNMNPVSDPSRSARVITEAGYDTDDY